jgi:uncharacterized protein with HEPN domain
MPKRDSEFFIVDMLIAINTVQRKTGLMQTPENLLRDEDAWFTVTRQLEIIGEAMRQILNYAALTYTAPSHWRNVVDLRNIVIHEYFGIDADQIFSIVKIDIPTLEQELIAYTKKLPDRDKLQYAIEQAKIDLHRAHRFASLEYLEALQKEIAV